MSHKKNICNPLYKNWLLAGLGLKYLKDGLQEFVFSEIEIYHNTIINDIVVTFNMAPPIDCSSQTILPYPIKGFPKTGVYQCDIDNTDDPSKCSKSCSNVVCHLIMKDIINTHRWKRPSFCNTNPYQWSSHSWEIAKCFLSSAGYVQASTIQDTDCSGLLSIIINMTCIGDKLKLCDKDVKSGQDIFSQVRKVRNKVLHSGTYELDNLTTDKYLDQMDIILKSIPFSQSSNAAITCLSEVKMKNFHVSDQDEEQIRKDALNAVKELTDTCLRNITEESVDMVSSRGNEVTESSVQAIAAKTSRSVQDMENNKSEYQNTIAVKAEKRLHDIREVAKDKIGRIASTCDEVTLSAVELITSTSKRKKVEIEIKVENRLEDIRKETQKSVHQIQTAAKEAIRTFKKRPKIVSAIEEHPIANITYYDKQESPVQKRNPFSSSVKGRIMASYNHLEKGDKFCLKHPKKELIFACDDCSNTPVCSLCISTEHKGHTVTDLDLLAPKKNIFVQDFNHEIQTDTISTIVNNIKSAEGSVSEFEQSISAAIDRVEGQRLNLKKTIDETADKNISVLKNILKKYKKLLQEFRTASEESKKRMEDLYQENRGTLKSNQNILLIDATEGLKDMETKPATFVEIPSAKFLSGSKSDSERLLKEAFGYIQILVESGADDQVGAHALDMSAKSEKRRHLLLQKPSFLNTRRVSFDPRSIEMKTDGTSCICDYVSKVLYLLDTVGDIREFKLEHYILDIAVHPVSDALYCVLYDNSVRLVDTSTGRTTQLFVPEGTSRALAFTNDGNLLVGDCYNPMVTVYSAELKKIRTFTYKGREPRHITVCRSTGRIAIACWFSVLVLENDFTELYRYTGPPDDQDVKSFDAIFDGYGYLLVADWRHNKGVHVVNAETGQHLKTITTNNIRYSRCLTLKEDDHVVVGTHEPHNGAQLLTFKYLEFTLSNNITI